MSIIITIVSNITMLVSQNIIFFGFFMLMSHGVNKKCLPHTSLSPTRFSPGLFVVLQEMLHQTSIDVNRLFAKGNAFSRKIRFFSFSSLLVGFDFTVLFICFYGVFFTVLPL